MINERFLKRSPTKESINTTARTKIIHATLTGTVSYVCIGDFVGKNMEIAMKSEHDRPCFSSQMRQLSRSDFIHGSLDLYRDLISDQKKAMTQQWERQMSGSIAKRKANRKRLKKHWRGLELYARRERKREEEGA